MRKVLLVVIAVSVNVFAQGVEHGIVSVHGDLNPFGYWAFYGPMVPLAEVGMRFYPVNRFGVGFGIGYMGITEVEGDSSSHTYPRSKDGSLSLSINLVGVVAQGDRAELGILGSGGVAIATEEESVSDPMVVDPYESTVYEYEKTVVPFFFLGLEPMFYLSDNMAMYSNFGIRFTFLPDSKFIDTGDPDYTFDDREDFWDDRDDAQTLVEISGLAIGFRYFF
jgi:hypothetical protein